MIYDANDRKYADYFWTPRLNEKPQPLMVAERSLWWVADDPFQGDGTPRALDWRAFRDYIHANIFLCRQHTFFIPTRFAPAARTYYDDPQTPRRIAYLALSLLASYSRPEPESYAPVLVSAGGDVRIGAAEVERLIVDVHKATEGGGIPFPLANLLVGAVVQEPKHLGRVGTILSTRNIAGRFVHFQDCRFPVDVTDLVWRFDDPPVMGMIRAGRNGQPKLMGSIDTPPIRRKLDWFLAERCEPNVIRRIVAQAVESGTPAFVCDYSRVPWDCAIQAFPAAAGRAPLCDPETVRLERSRQAMEDRRNTP